jgi:hypothetical protein
MLAARTGTAGQVAHENGTAWVMRSLSRWGGLRPQRDRRPHRRRLRPAHDEAADGRPGRSSVCGMFNEHCRPSRHACHWVPIRVAGCSIATSRTMVRWRSNDLEGDRSHSHLDPDLLIYGWSPLTESNRRPSPYHREFPVVIARHCVLPSAEQLVGLTPIAACDRPGLSGCGIRNRASPGPPNGKDDGGAACHPGSARMAQCRPVTSKPTVR